MNRIMVLLLCAVLCVITPFSVFSLEVDRGELGSVADGTDIEFINYTGPQDTINTIEEIQGIGRNLASGVTGSTRFGDTDRYYIIRAVDPSVITGLDADILFFGSRAQVDHIDNVRRIISAYLQTAYNYSERDATTLSVFITVYNAVYRGKLESYKTRYKPLVLSYLTAEHVGLSVRYTEWPGKTQIVIPLSDPRLAGTISTIDTSSLTSRDVVDRMKEDEGAGIDSRRDMAELKERESDAAQERAAESQKAAADARSDADQKKVEADAATRAAQEAQRIAESARKEAEARPDDEAAQMKAVETAQVAEKKSEEAAEKREESRSAAQTVAQKESEAAADQKLADTKALEVQSERREIASDVQKQVDEEVAAQQAAADAALAAIVPGFALRLVDPGQLLSELVLVNLNDGRIIQTSPLNSIRNRMIFETDGTLIAIAGKKGGNSSIRLVRIDTKTLEMTKQGADPIGEHSVLVNNGNDWYAVIERSNGSFAVARFDSMLEMKAQSAISVIGETPVMVTSKGLLVQDIDGKIRLLRSTDLVDQTLE